MGVLVKKPKTEIRSQGKALQQEIDLVFHPRSSSIIQSRTENVVYSQYRENIPKTNAKKTFFIEAMINEKDQEIYNQSRKNVHKLLNEHYQRYLREKLKKHENFVELSMNARNHGIVVMVKNPKPLLKEEEEKIRLLLSEAIKGDISDFSVLYSDSDNYREGAGLGLFLIIQVLKKLGINPAYFRIGVIKNNTVARIEFPLNRNCAGFSDKQLL